jgi:hypothetical protein
VLEDGKTTLIAVVADDKDCFSEIEPPTVTPDCSVSKPALVIEPDTFVPVAKKIFPRPHRFAVKLTPVWVVDKAPEPVLAIIERAALAPSSATVTLLPIKRVEFAPSTTDDIGTADGNGTFNVTCPPTRRLTLASLFVSPTGFAEHEHATAASATTPTLRHHKGRHERAPPGALP